MKEKQGKMRREVAGAGKGRNEGRGRFTSHFSVIQKSYAGKHAMNTPNYQKMGDWMLWLLKLLSDSLNKSLLKIGHTFFKTPQLRLWKRLLLPEIGGLEAFGFTALCPCPMLSLKNLRGDV